MQEAGVLLCRCADLLCVQSHAIDVVQLKPHVLNVSACRPCLTDLGKLLLVRLILCFLSISFCLLSPLLFSSDLEDL